MNEVTIEYPMRSILAGYRSYEQVAAKATDVPGEYELISHTIFLPLAPGDVVTTRDRDVMGSLLESPEVTGITTLVDIWTLDVDFALPTDITFGKPLSDRVSFAIDSTIAAWKREAWATKHGGLSAYVSAEDESWLEDRVILCPYVDHVEKVRWPGMKIDWDVAVVNAQPGELEGPWS